MYNFGHYQGVCVYVLMCMCEWVYVCMCEWVYLCMCMSTHVSSIPTNSPTSSSSIPDDLHRIENLQHFDVRLNKIKGGLPHTTAELRNLVRLSLQGNGFSELNTRRLPFLELLNCSENALRSLEIPEGPLTVLTAKNNRTSMYIISCGMNAHR